ncbi:hypothetical protein [Acidithiobacillus ferrivorans]|uniref:IS110 family transposase n=1 Tax=Acidithiobacillus ferrivorans TaxID=160808 RepID=A0A7T4WDP1_9PROT|nr:hypothetical protein [Acidithiobacillus ferrivorans]QQD72690.1 hypothetical protein H2515_15285 [Acidithiobacillus ferrivorans]
MNEVKTIGIDLAKNLLALHCVDAAGKPVFRKMARRADVATGGGNGGNGRIPVARGAITERPLLADITHPQVGRE